MSSFFVSTNNYGNLTLFLPQSSLICIVLSINTTTEGTSDPSLQLLPLWFVVSHSLDVCQQQTADPGNHVLPPSTAVLEAEQKLLESLLPLGTKAQSQYNNIKANFFSDYTPVENQLNLFIDQSRTVVDNPAGDKPVFEYPADAKPLVDTDKVALNKSELVKLNTDLNKLKQNQAAKLNTISEESNALWASVQSIVDSILESQNSRSFADHLPGMLVPISIFLEALQRICITDLLKKLTPDSFINKVEIQIFETVGGHVENGKFNFSSIVQTPCAKFQLPFFAAGTSTDQWQLVNGELEFSLIALLGKNFMKKGLKLYNPACTKNINISKSLSPTLLNQSLSPETTKVIPGLMQKSVLHTAALDIAATKTTNTISLTPVFCSKNQYYVISTSHFSSLKVNSNVKNNVPANNSNQSANNSNQSANNSNQSSVSSVDSRRAPV